MKTDPFVQPINLAQGMGGDWSWKDSVTGAQFAGPNFWVTSRQVYNFLRRNHRLQTYEKCQMDLLLAKRKQLGLQVEQKIVLGQPSERARRIVEYTRKKPRGGCRTCGKTKAIH